MKYSPRCICLLTITAIFIPFSASVNAGEVKGVEVPEQITFGDSTLVLNGTAVRSVWGFSVYVAGLYLTEPSNDQEAIMTPDREGKRVHMTMLRKVSASQFESTIRDNIDTNFSASEKQHFADELERLLACFNGDTVLEKGSVVNIDYLPEQGTLVTVNGCGFDPIAGDEFYHAVLRLWIGTPPQKSVKYGLLGKAI